MITDASTRKGWIPPLDLNKEYKLSTKLTFLFCHNFPEVNMVGVRGDCAEGGDLSEGLSGVFEGWEEGNR